MKTARTLARVLRFVVVVAFALVLFSIWVAVETGARILRLPGTRFGREPLWYPPDW